MRISVDIGEDDLKALDSIATLENVSRSSLIRRAIGKFLSGNSPSDRSEAFGLWRSRTVDGLAYQEAIRCEWQDKTP
ncbi:MULTISPECIES: ribbon-helix-helix protein, CopG family [unclassified Rhizobium]|jgi:predicted transcriptional regulator|uniref:ribbon-helix-helix protein, CopG family n=1 Tax=unclassified Rhizobium TaxID=2613769 RepID=UPI000DDBF9DF|nr:ribbon-helix-helix protein, CopG family [Rhizobium sp. UBA1881]